MRTLFLGAMCMLVSGCTAHAHTGAVTAPAAHVSVSWTWVPGHWTYIKTGVRKDTKCRKHTWVDGYWYHDRYGKSHRAYRDGPPPRKSSVKAKWVSGRWILKGGKRHWVPGHWSQNRSRR